MADCYSYLIGWTNIDKWYYGVRYGSKAKVGDIWQNYFTSSKLVHILAEVVGPPDVVQVRRVFKTPEQAMIWEQKLLTRIDACASSFWLNQTNGGGGCNTPPVHSGRIWINNGAKNKRIFPHQLSLYENRGWCKGRLLEEHQKFWKYQKGPVLKCPTTGRFIRNENEEDL